MTFAFLLLFLAIPIPAIVFNQITFPLQLLASRFGEFSIAACGIPVLREGNVITLATTTLEVAEACSGIRSLVSLLTLALLWGYFTGSPRWLRWVLALSSVPIAIFANGIRVAGTGIAAHAVGPEAAEGFFHTFSGWLVFLVAGGLLLLVHQVAVWLVPSARGDSDAGEESSAYGPASKPESRQSTAALSVRRSLAAAGVLLAAALSLGAVTRTEAAGLRQPLRNVPSSLEGWEGIDGPVLDPDILAVLRVDEYLNRAYRRAGGPWISLYVGYYASQKQGQTMHSPLNCMPGAGWEPAGKTRVQIPVALNAAEGKRPTEVNRVIVQKGLDRQLVMYWYQAHGRIVASEYWGKIYTVVDAIRLNRSDGAMVRIIVPIASADKAAERAAEQAALEFAGTFLPVLSTYLNGQ
jgi:exosortase D (VPLPA-CTERM-specific)